jgi:hypothetical protein
MNKTKKIKEQMNFLKDGLNLKRYELSVIESVLTTWTIEIAKEDYDHLRDVIGSLMIKQFKGKNKQDQYRAVINTLFSEFTQSIKRSN